MQANFEHNGVAPITVPVEVENSASVSVPVEVLHSDPRTEQQVAYEALRDRLDGMTKTYIRGEEPTQIHKGAALTPEEHSELVEAGQK